MLISEFSRATGLSRDTVRFYVRLGLLRPEAGQKGGRNPYQLFTREDLEAAESIQIGQALGMSLKELAAMELERRDGRLPRDRLTTILSEQLERLDAKAAELQRIRKYVRAKLDWLSSDQSGPRPTLNRGDGRT